MEKEMGNSTTLQELKLQALIKTVGFMGVIFYVATQVSGLF